MFKAKSICHLNPHSMSDSLSAQVVKSGLFESMNYFVHSLHVLSVYWLYCVIHLSYICVEIVIFFKCKRQMSMIMSKPILLLWIWWSSQTLFLHFQFISLTEHNLSFIGGLFQFQPILHQNKLYSQLSLSGHSSSSTKQPWFILSLIYLTIEH